MCYIDKSHKKEAGDDSLLSEVRVFQLICNLRLAKTMHFDSSCIKEL